MEKIKIIILAISFLLSACVTQAINPISTVSTPINNNNLTPSSTPVITSTPSSIPTAYPLPEENNFNRKIVYFSNYEKVFKLNSINSDGTDNKLLDRLENGEIVDTFEDPVNLFVSLDGTKVFYMTYTLFKGTTNIYTINSDGSNKKRLFTGRMFNIDISRDRKKLIFTDGFIGNSNICIYDLEKESPTKLDIKGRSPSFSPDNSKISFIVEDTELPQDIHEGQYQLYIVNADGSNVKKVKDEKNSYLSPQWAPNGSKILFNYSDLINQKSSISSINPDGSEFKVVTYKSNEISISPDGTKLSYNSYPDGLFVSDLDGSNEFKLLSNTNNSDIIWSPDSKRILFNSNGLHIINIDGTGLKQLTPKSIPIISSAPPMNSSGYSSYGTIRYSW